MFELKYLTEDKLAEILEIVFPSFDFIRNKKVPNSNINNRPDFRNDELKLIIEFDGYLHYSSSKNILTDINKDLVYSSMNYKIIRIPYFIQLTNDVIFLLFNKNVNLPLNYPHGFINDKALLPCDFCELGINRFLLDIKKFEIVQFDIIKSLNQKN